MPAVAISPIGGSGQQFFDNNGAVLAGGLLYTYAAGTTTPLASYTDSTGGVANANPIVLDAAGRISGGTWLVSGSLYKLVLKTSAGVTLGTWDNISGYGATTAQAAAIALSTATIAAIAATTAAAISSSTHSIGLATYTKLQFNSEVYDLGNNYDPALYRFTAPAAGMYQVTAQGQFTKGTPVVGEYVLIAIYKNGVLLWTGKPNYIYNVTYPTQCANVEFPVKLAANDYVEIFGYGTGAAGVWTFNSVSFLQSQLAVARIS
jgi:hypothetical protein